MTNNFMQVFAVCVFCGATAPGMEPDGWAIWERRITSTFPLPYFLVSCPNHADSRGIDKHKEKA